MQKTWVHHYWIESNTVWKWKVSKRYDALKNEEIVLFQSVIAESLKELTNKCLSVFRKNIERKNNADSLGDLYCPMVIELYCSGFSFFSCKLVSNPTKTLPRICPIFVSVARHRKRMVEQTVELNIFKDRATYF